MLNNKVKKKRIAFVILGGFGIGGAEIRFANAFCYLQSYSQEFDFFLITSGKKFVSFQKHNIINKNQKNILINCPHIYITILKKVFFDYAKNQKNNTKQFLIKKVLDRIAQWIALIYNALFLQIVLKVKNIQVIHPITKGSPACGVVKLINPDIKLITSFLSLVPTWHKKGFSHLHSSQYLSLKKADLIDVLGLTYYQTFKELKISYNPDKISTTKCSFVFPCEVASEKEKWIVFSGRLEPQKNPLLFIETAKIIIDKGFTDIMFFMLGTGPLKKEILSFINLNNLNRFFKVQYSLNQQEILSKSIIFCSLQEFDNYPSQSLLQAMILENGIIATDFGQTNLLVKHGETGFLSKPNPLEMAYYVEFLLNNPEKLEEISRNAALLVKEKHNINKFAKYLLDIYSKR